MKLQSPLNHLISFTLLLACGGSLWSNDKNSSIPTPPLPTTRTSVAPRDTSPLPPSPPAEFKPQELSRCLLEIADWHLKDKTWPRPIALLFTRDIHDQMAGWVAAKEERTFATLAIREMLRQPVTDESFGLHVEAMLLAGELHLDGLAEDLADRISVGGMFIGPDRPWNFPAQTALIKLGSDAVPIVLERWGRERARNVRGMFVEVLCRIDGAEVARFRLERELKLASRREDTAAHLLSLALDLIPEQQEDAPRR